MATSKQRQLLAEILAHADAAFAPQRHWKPLTCSTTIFEARRDYRLSGIPWKVCGGGTRTRREAAFRLRDAGLAVIAGGERITHIRLTDEGDVEAWRLLGLPNVDSAYLTMQEIQAAGGTVCETYLGDKDYGDEGINEDLITTERMCLPGLVRGWLASESTVGGHVLYGLTEAGEKRLAEPPPPDYSDAGDADLRRLYFKTFNREQQRIRFAEPEDTKEIGYCAYSEGLLCRIPPFNGIRRKQ